MPVPLAAGLVRGAVGTLTRQQARAGALGRRSAQKVGPPNLSAEVSGLDKLQQRLRGTEQRVVSIQEEALQITRREVQGAAPVVTGRLRRSVVIRGGSVWVLAPYAGWVNRRGKSRGYIERGVRRAKRLLRDRYRSRRRWRQEGRSSGR